MAHDQDDADTLAQMVKGTRSKGKLPASQADMERVRHAATGSQRPTARIPDATENLVQTINKALTFWEEGAMSSSQPGGFTHPEDPHVSNDPSSEMASMERCIVAVAWHVLQSGTPHPSELQCLAQAMQDNCNAQLDFELPYESRPRVERRARLTTAISSQDELTRAADDGVLLMCFVQFDKTGQEKVSFCTGFAVQGGDRMSKSPGGALVVTCGHALENAIQNAQETAVEYSVALAMTRSGHFFRWNTLLSHLPGQDLVLLQLSHEAVWLNPDKLMVEKVDAPQITTLPLSPYPAVVDTPLAVSSFGGWVPDESHDTLFSGLASENVMQQRWARAKVTGYRDPIGSRADTGTYDELAQMDFALDWGAPETPASVRASASTSAAMFPMPGSSGGPVVDVESGSVVGIVRGQRSSKLGENLGDAVPAEKVFECACALYLT